MFANHKVATTLTAVKKHLKTMDDLRDKGKDTDKQEDTFCKNFATLMKFDSFKIGIAKIVPVSPAGTYRFIN